MYVRKSILDGKKQVYFTTIKNILSTILRAKHGVYYY